MYIVLNEHTLGYIIPFHRPAQFPQMGILHASTLRGSRFTPLDGIASLPLDMEGVRPAPAQDFRDFRVKIPPDFDN